MCSTKQILYLTKKSYLTHSQYTLDRHFKQRLLIKRSLFLRPANRPNVFTASSTSGKPDSALNNPRQILYTFYKINEKKNQLKYRSERLDFELSCQNY